MYFSTLLRIVLKIYPHTFDANPHAVEGPPVHIATPSRGERLGINFQEGRRKRIRRWEYHPGAAYVSEFA